MSGPAAGWDQRVSAWAAARPDIRAMFQIGSRVQAGANVDEWSDYDYQIITSRPEAFRDGSFARELGPCWAVGSEDSFGRVVKHTAVYDGAREADFVILRHADLLAATTALRWPGTEAWWPRPLREGVRALRIVAGRGWRIVKGGPAWERRYARIQPFSAALTETEFRALSGDFWVQAVWSAKKALRGEYLASQRSLHRYVIENCLLVLQQEAQLAGGRPFPLGRRAESWLGAGQSAIRAVATKPEREVLLTALRQVASEFARASEAVATAQGWPVPQFPEVQAWLGTLA